MKKVVFLIMLLTLLLSGCGKKEPDTTPIPPTVTHTVLVSQTGKGTVNPDTLTRVVRGESLTITATPDSGYTLYSLKVRSMGEEKKITIDPTTSSFQYTLPKVEANTVVVFEFVETDNLIISILTPPFRLKSIKSYNSNGEYEYTLILDEDDLSRTDYYYYPEGKTVTYNADGSVYFSANWYLKERVLYFGGNPYPIVELTPTKLVYKLDFKEYGYVLYTYERN